jgi:regulatory protein
LRTGSEEWMRQVGERKKITRIEKPYLNKPRYHIYVDGEFLLSIHEDILVKYRLHKGMELDESEIHEWLEAEEYNKVKQKALHYLSYKPRTTHEVKMYLGRKGFERETVEQVILELEKSGFLNDLEFAKAWVNERQHHKGYGKRRLKQELLNKGMDPAVVDEALIHIGEEDERQLAISIAERRYLRLCHESWPRIERRLGNYLVRQGFSMGVVYEVLNLFRARHEEEKGNGP